MYLCWRKKKNECLSLFVSIFFECYQRENKFSPFWVYSQWDKLNLIIVSHRLAKFYKQHNLPSLVSRLKYYSLSLFNRITIDVWLLPIFAAMYLMLLPSLCNFNRNWSAYSRPSFVSVGVLYITLF